MKNKRKKKKRYSLALLGSMVFFLACGTGESLRLRVKLPRKPPVDLKAYQALKIAHFLFKGEKQETDFDGLLRDFFQAEFENKAGIPVSLEEIVPESEQVLEDEAYWKKTGRGMEGALLLTGSIEYTEEVRKAIKAGKKRRFETPFPEDSRIMERKFYSLTLDLFLVDPQSGKIIYQRKFKESKSYQNPNQTAPFAFYDLIHNVRNKLFRQLLGEEQTQERYLIK